jgi:transcriptional regulator with XRE-family HTH domain
MIFVGQNRSLVELLSKLNPKVIQMSLVNLNLDPSFLPDNIRNLRKLRNWSQGELAENVGLNRGNIASYEKGTAEPKICNLLKIAHLFGVSILDLLGRDLTREDDLNGNSVPLKAAIEAEKWIAYVEHAEEVERVVEGIFHCHVYKMKHISNADKDVKIISNQFDQLYEATRSLLKHHKEILGHLERSIEAQGDGDQ